jgi:hypothetical protein
VSNLPGISQNLQYLYNNSQTVHQADGRLDFNRTSADRIFFRYSVLDSVNDNTTNVNQFFQNGNADSKTVVASFEAAEKEMILLLRAVQKRTSSKADLPK